MRSTLVALFCASLLIASSYGTVTTVHIVTMNHLDVGFAQLAYNIINLYFDQYFPNAAVTAQQLRDSGGPQRLIYTTHAWLMDIYVNCDKYAAINALPPGPIHCPNATALQMVIKAINQGDISWHGFPFNAEMEFMMNPDFLAAGIETVHWLDAQFNMTPKATISQRDVPGTTRSVLPIFVQSGIQALSVGVNGASAPPDVPKIFNWIDPVSRASIIAMWHPGGYGGDSLTDCVTFPNFTHALCWDFRGDNAGPPAIPEVLETYKTVQAEFPGANVTASTYDEFVAQALTIKDQLPVLQGEIGDTWIHGVASDPLKTAQTREIVRARSECVAAQQCDPSQFSFHAFDMMLVKNAEHTWGLDVKTWLKDTVNWSNELFNKAKNGSNFQIMVTGWIEQRNYIAQAVSALGNSAFAAEVSSRIAQFGDPVIDLDGYSKVDPTQLFSCGRFQIGFNDTTGSINSLLDTTNKYYWATASNPLAAFLYQTYSQDDYTAFLNDYMNMMPPPGWAWLDFGKPNMTDSHAIYLPTLVALYQLVNGSNYQFYVNLEMPEATVTFLGAPKAVWVYISIPSNGDTIDINVIWQNKTSTRLAEGLFVSFIPSWVGNTTYTFNKLGEWIGVNEVLQNGSNHLHVLQQGVRYANGPRSLIVNSLDAAIVCIGTPNAFPTPLRTFPDPTQGSHFVLYDNVWGTNYIMWYPYLEEDWQQLFRFQLTFA